MEPKLGWLVMTGILKKKLFKPHCYLNRSQSLTKKSERLQEKVLISYWSDSSSNRGMREKYQETLQEVRVQQQIQSVFTEKRLGCPTPTSKLLRVDGRDGDGKM